MGRVYKRDDGRRVRRKVGRDRKAALEVLKALEGDAVRRQAGLSRQPVSVFDFIEQNLENLKLDLKDSSITRYRAQFDHLKRFLRSQDVALLSQVTPEVIERFKALRLSEGASKRTVNHELATIGAMLRRAVDMGYLENNPVSKVKRLRLERKQPPRYWTAPEIERVKTVCNALLRDMFEVLVETGMRRGEIVNLEWSGIDFTNGRIHIRPRADWTPKHGRSREIPMRPRVREVLERRKADAKYRLVFRTPSGKKIEHIWRLLSRAYKRAGVHNATVHSTRHSFASHAVMSGVDL